MVGAMLCLPMDDQLTLEFKELSVRRYATGELLPRALNSAKPLSKGYLDPTALAYSKLLLKFSHCRKRKREAIEVKCYK